VTGTDTTKPCLRIAFDSFHGSVPWSDSRIGRLSTGTPAGSRLLDPVLQTLGSSFQLGCHESDHEPIRRPIPELRHPYTCRSKVRQGVPDASQRVSSSPLRAISSNLSGAPPKFMAEM
jgi:hypothetical protein